MKKFLLMVISLFVLVLGGCGESKEIETVKKAYENQLKSQKFRAEMIMNMARMRGVNRQAAFDSTSLLDELAESISLDRTANEGVRDIIVAMNHYTSDSQEIHDMVSKLYIKEGYLYGMADTLEYEDIKVPKAMTFENCDWWEIKKDGKKLVAAGEKTTGYAVFDILEQRVTLIGYYYKNLKTKEFQFNILDNIDNQFVPIGAAVFIYLLEDGKLAEIMNQ